MIFSGALTDRFGARPVMIWSTWIRMICLFLLAALVLSQQIDMWMIYIVAFAFGVVDAFAGPASLAILPKVIDAELLPPANALMQGFSQISVMLGPSLPVYSSLRSVPVRAMTGQTCPASAWCFFWMAAVSCCP